MRQSLRTTLPKTLAFARWVNCAPYPLLATQRDEKLRGHPIDPLIALAHQPDPRLHLQL